MKYMNPNLKNRKLKNRKLKIKTKKQKIKIFFEITFYSKCYSK